ncbi:MAG: dienelactone hydrolase family protein [Planctomycetes bacterium]|nr:dienelactone hydrolase family protein [Planctomycetota bacterium]
MTFPRHCRRIPLFAAALTVLCLGLSTASAQQVTGKFVDQTFNDGTVEHKYVVFVPAGYRSDQPAPAILFLHGAGERGKDNHLQLTAGLAPFVQARAATFPFVVVFPQCESSEARILEAWQAGSPDGARALLALDDAEKKYTIDRKRVVLSGWSMGGYGAWSLAMSEPARWSAVVPLAGGGDVSKVAAAKDVPVWAFHGSDDRLVKAADGRKIVEALQAAGGTATFTELPGVGHYLCDNVFGSDAVFKWMLDPRNSPTELGTGELVKPVNPITVPFVPAVEIPQAVGLRLGNDALSALSYSVPQAVPKEMLTGRLNDMFDSTVAQGRSFGIRFSGISYAGQLERVLTKGIGKDRVQVDLGIRNVVLNIAGTSISGERHSAQAGPINIVIGTRAPAWLTLELSPYIESRAIRLKLLKSSFQIADDNWYVTAPAGVSVQGFGMTEEAVVSGLTSGLYGAKGRIENEVLAVVPGVVKQVEKNLVLPDTGSPVSQSGAAIAKLWPLPIYPPRLRIWPEQIATDENGISLIVGLTAASLDPYGPVKPLKRVDGVGATLDRLPTDTALHAMVAPQILTPLTEMAVEADQLKLDLLDIPNPMFTKMADRATLQEFIPDLKQYGDDLQVRSSLRVLRPLHAGNPAEATADEANKPFEFQLKGIEITVAIKTDAKAEWKPCAVFELNISEQVKATLEKPAYDQRVVELQWQPVSNVTGTGKFAEGYIPTNKELNADGYVEQFRTAWQTFTKGQSVSSMEVPDLAIGASRLRLNDINWKAPLIEVTYNLARIKISNLSNETFTYQTKSPTSPFSQPYSLKPGDSHEFEIPYPLTYRRVTDKGEEIYTLLVGSHSEFRVPLAGGAPRLFAANRPAPAPAPAPAEKP